MRNELSWVDYDQEFSLNLCFKVTHAQHGNQILEIFTYVLDVM